VARVYERTIQTEHTYSSLNRGPLQQSQQIQGLGCHNRRSGQETREDRYGTKTMQLRGRQFFCRTYLLFPVATTMHRLLQQRKIKFCIENRSQTFLKIMKHCMQFNNYKHGGVREFHVTSDKFRANNLSSKTTTTTTATAAVAATTTTTLSSSQKRTLGCYR
jgi:hypothetical protein